MKVSKEDKEEFFRRKEVLKFAKKELKKDFVGLDNIIDEVIDLIEPWYLFPNGQIRPTIVNLWGMTGVGKTSLIKRMFELIELKDSLYKFDVGDYASQDNTKLSYAFSEKLKNREKQQIGIIFDEFQLGRTIDENGAELEKSGLRAMWDLLDSGKISILQSSYYGTKLYQLSLKLEDCVENGNVEAKAGKITKNKDYHDKYFKSTEDDDEPAVTGRDSKKEGNEAVNTEKENLFVPEDFYWYIQMVWDNRFITDRELHEYLKTMDHVESVEFLGDTLKRAFKPMEYDYSSSCVFVIGNIDEAYRMSKNFNPDSDADRFYKHSLKITLPQIKSALQKRFRSEQIARLGNSHIIYPAFSSKVYEQLIVLELDKARDKVKEKFDIKIDFDESINDILYKEGVFPTQGARPVFTTVTSVIESYIGKIVKDILESGENVGAINWKYFNEKHYIDFLTKRGKKLFSKEYKVRLKVESLRKSDSSQMQAHVAIHEAGHAVAAIYSAKIMPTEIVSRTANMSEGHCAIDFPSLDTKELFEHDIVTSLGGYCAEKMIFGEEKLGAGTGSDFERASGIALNMAKNFGMAGIPMFIGQKSANANTTWSSANVDKYDVIAEEIINSCQEKCVKILTENKYLLLKIGEYLSTHSRMDECTLRNFVADYGTNVKTITKKEYHNFKEILEKKLKKEEKKFKPKKGIKQRYGNEKLEA